jgi:hypothetical protein
MLHTSHMVPAYHKIICFTPVTWFLISQNHMLHTSHMVPAYRKIICFTPVIWFLHIKKSYASHQSYSYGPCISQNHMLQTSHMVPASVHILVPYASHQSHGACISKYHMLHTSYMVPAYRYHSIICFTTVTWSLHITVSYATQ